MRKLVNFYPFQRVIFIALLSLIINVGLTGQCAPGTIEGNVFLDFNFDGVKDVTETGESGVFVRVYNNNGIIIGQSLTDSEGNYSIIGLNDGQDYLFEFDVPDNYKLSATGTEATSDIMFVRSPNCNLNLGLINGATNCNATSELILSCFVNGIEGENPGQETLIGIDHNFNATTGARVLATKAETGSVWGMAYNADDNTVYSAAFVKQHAGLSAYGHDAIFATQVNGTPTTDLLVELADLGVETGEMPVQNAVDCSYGPQVGKYGIGALTIDDNYEYLYATNLFNNSIVRIDLDNPVEGTTEVYAVPNPSCSFNDFSVFAVKYHSGLIYTGVTCTAETSQDEDDTYIHIYTLNPSSGNFNLVFSSDYSRGVWIDDNSQVNAVMQWLTDIDFTDEGNMVIGLSDRKGHVYCNGTSSRVDSQKGDILLVENRAGDWVLESNGATSTLTGTGVGNGQGPDGGEFFGDDYFPKNETVHPEIALGSLVIIPGTGEVVTAVFDPIFNSYSGGLHRYSTNSGEKVGSKELYNSNISEYFGKATGFGDIVAACGTIPAEAGNLVWIDSNCDGIQTAGESGIAGLTVNIYDDNCQLVGTTTTDDNGRYHFNNQNVDLNGDGDMDGMALNANYYITLDQANYDIANQSFNLGNIYYSPTVASTENKWNSNFETNDATCIVNDLNGMPVAAFVAGSGNNATLDLGLKEGTNFDLALRKEIVSSPNFKVGDQIDFEITVFNQGDRITSEIELVDYLTEAFVFEADQNTTGWVMQGNHVKKTIAIELAPNQSHSEILSLKFVGSTDIEDYTNYAEIASAKDILGSEVADADSVADDDNSNDKGGVIDSNTDNLITDDGTIDEDDHDPANLKVLDLALKNVLRDIKLYDVDEQATFDITVYNQGNVAVEGFEITNMFSDCMDFVASDNADWTQTLPGFAKTAVNTVLLPGESTTVSIELKINSSCDYNDIVNLAEISAFTSSTGITTDVDSDADDFLLNDKGGSPYDYTDNLLTDDGTFDEDDHDPAVLSVRRVDLALMKTTPSSIYNHGDIIDFEIKIYNQGDVAAGTVMIADYLPEHTQLMDDSWTVSPLDPSGNTVYKTIEFEDGFKAGEEYTTTITLRVMDTAPVGEFLINEAEIAAVTDIIGTDISHSDVDSEADSDANNDMGGVFMSVTDDVITDNGLMDEDDHDPSGFIIAELDIISNCTCLNQATDPYNGLFETTIVITSISGQTWTIDEEINLYDISSTPGNLVSLAGYTLTEFIYGNGISEYTFTGVFEDSERYEIRFTNGFGTYLQASGGGPDCSYNRPTISSESGLSAVCSGSIHTYRVSDLQGCTNYTWSLSGGGTILGPNNQSEVTVQWDNVIGGPYTLRVTPNCGLYCLAPVDEDIMIGNGGGVMSCLSTVNISLNFDCAATVDADVFLTSPVPMGTVYQLMILDKHNKVVPNNYLTEEYLWETLTAKVVDPCNGNSCWSTLVVEDKMAPAIQCGDIQLPCFLMNTYEPLVYDNCTDATYNLIGETVRPLDCDPDYIKEVTRTYVSIDGYGNQSQPCEQVIRLERINFDEIVPPADYLLLQDTHLTCVDSIYNEDGEVDYHITGAPTLNGFNIFPIQDLYCNVAIEYDDFLVADFGCVRKIMRTWRIYEDWCTIGETWTYVQTIEIADTNAPEIECPEDITVSSGGGPGCERTLDIPLPSIVDDCASDFVIDLSYDGGFLQNLTEAPTLTIPSGTWKIIYNVYDPCENVSSCDVDVTVLDERPPVAVCDENTVVSLRSDGTAKAFAETFDDGSYDDCSLFNLLVKRPDTECDCNRPVFDDMHFLGERDGRYYYLSKFLTHGSKAFLYSEAYGGLLLKLESHEEADWVYEQTRHFITSSYYIGLSDFDHQGRFTWYNHEDPTFDYWDNGQPVDVGDHVITNPDGEWVVVDGNDVEAYYVLEVSDPCGYSDEVHFCCEDTAEEQMVIFRAIDYFGKVNECMVMVEVQDKVAPVITCPPNYELSCDTPLNLEDLSEYGFATATDQCGVEIREELIDLRNSCGFGDLVRRFYAEDNNGFSTCDQLLRFSQTNKFDNNTIIWPLDFTTDLGCNSGDLHPDSLAVEFGRPRFTPTGCSQVAATYDDQTFDFSGSNGSDACLKILRRWTVIDWCQMEDTSYEPAYYEQVIKVNNTIGPDIRTGCDSIVINTFECEYEDVLFTAVANDDCTPDEDLRGRLLIDINSDGNGVFDMEEDFYSNVVSFDGQLPIGEHFALISFSDFCGNTTTCTKIIQINNIKGPTAACIDGLSVALEPMDLDGDGEFDTEMACIKPWMLDASSTHECDVDFVLAFSADPADTTLCFDCENIGDNTVQLWAIDAFGNTDFCEANVEVQDNNMQDFCPRFDLALIKQLDTVSTPGPFMQGSDVAYNITVFNQGNMDAFNIDIVDYIPDGLELNDGNWSDLGNGIASYNDGIEFLEDSTSVVITVNFTISEDFMGFSIENFAEIAFADDDDNPGNGGAEDADSVSDTENDDTVGGDDVVDNDNNDEDDHDPEVIEVVQTFDLALDKDCADRTQAPFSPGSEVTYVITVENQGTLDAHSVQIADLVPNGLVLNDSDWVQNGNVATLVTPIALVERNSSVEVEIDFLIEDDFMGESITNTAQIIDPDNEFPQDDEDSDPDNDDGDQSEDDEDAKMIEVVQIFDLALTKVIDTDNTPDPVNPGDDVTFIITVYNQGSLDATSIQISDYIPAGFSYDPLKNSDFGLSGSTATATIPFLEIDDSTERVLVLTLDSDLPSATIVNSAEITSAVNALGLTDQDDDLANTNDGTNPELDTDNDIDDERPSAPGTADNPDDEDDYDPAAVDVFCPPTADCTADFEVALDEDGNLVIDPVDIDNGSFDSCSQDLNLSISQSIFDCTDLGSITVTLTVSVDSGLSDTCETTITIVDDTDPMAVCEDITVELDSNGEATITAADVDGGSTDACNDISLAIDVTSFDCDDLFEMNPVILTVTDGFGNSDICEANVTVEDNEDPNVICVNLIEANLDAMGQASFTIAQYIMSSSDNCGVTGSSATDTTFDCSDVSDVPVQVTVTVEDASGNEGDCTVNVLVQDDLPPECTLDVPGPDVVAETTITLVDLGYTASDNCTASGDITAVIDPTMFDCMDVGNMETVTVTVTDAEGNMSTCSTTVTVTDDTTPLCVAQDITVTLDANGEATITADDIDNGSTAGCNTDPDLSIDVDMFDCSDVGDNDVVLTVTANAQSVDCDAVVTVEDNMAPVIDCADAFTLSLSGTMVTITPMDIIDSSSDNCGIMSSTIDMAAFDCDDDGMTFTVTATVTDVNMNVSTCTTDVTVDDDEAPSCTLIADITIAPNQTITIEDLVTDINTYFSDNCAEDAATVELDQDMFDCTMLGANVVTVTVSDGSGNNATCTSTVTVEDIDAPVCIAQDITITLGPDGMYDLMASEIDNGSFSGCDPIESLEVTPDFFACNDAIIAPTEVILTVTDTSGVFSTCTALVTVVDDLDPMVTCQDITISLDGDGEASITAMDVIDTASDECGIDSESVTPSDFDCDDKMSTTTVTVTVSDPSGNSATCDAEVTVVDDEAPICTVAPDLTFAPEVTIDPNAVLGSFSDNCATASANTTLDDDFFTCNELGQQSVTLTVDDGCGNTSTCTGTIEIVDSSLPVCVPMDITVSLDFNGEYDLDASEVDGGSFATCGSTLTVEVDPDMFDCDDLGDNIVTLTVTSSGGGSDTCEATVTVEDTNDPVIVCPADMTFPCETDISDFTLFGDAEAFDNCDQTPIIFEDPDIDVNTCNVGTITRVFTATDDSGNSAVCTQIVTISGPANPLVEADITWPTSPFDAGDCIADPDSIDAGMPIVDTSNLDCFNISISFSDFFSGDAMCDGTITRTWTVIDSCQAPGGVFEFVQIIDIDDTVGPDITGPADMTIILPPGNTTCDTFLDLSGAIVTDCVTGFTVSNDSPFAIDNDSEDASGTYPVGETLVSITATDVCGNDSVYSYLVNVVDTTAFISDCIKIIDNIEMGGTVVVDTSQAGVTVDFGNCMGFNYMLSFSDQTQFQDTIVATCSDVGIATYTIYLWSGGLVIDSCTNLFQIVDGGGFCTTPLAGTVIGEVSTPDNRFVQGVGVELMGSPFEMAYTDVEGSYAFPEMEFGGSYDVMPIKDDDHLNGVSTLDLISIQKHILGTQKLDTPYKLIAADIDRSGNITTTDLLELRKLILGVYDRFPENTSWRMIDKSHKFLDQQDPFAGAIPESYQIDAFEQSMIVDFVGVKVGDINGSAFVNAQDRYVDGRSSKKFYYELSENMLSAGDIVEIEFNSEELQMIEGIQHTLMVDPNLAEIVTVSSDNDLVSQSNFNIIDQKNGLINVSWHRASGADLDSENLFKLTLLIKEETYVSDILSIDESGLRSEAYFEGSAPASVGILYRDSEVDQRALSLYQNAPNPWTDYTDIRFYTPEATEYTLNVYDINGKLLMSRNDSAVKGNNTITLDNGQFEVGGVMYYELIASNTRLINKMLLVR